MRHISINPGPYQDTQARKRTPPYLFWYRIQWLAGWITLVLCTALVIYLVLA